MTALPSSETQAQVVTLYLEQHLSVSRISRLTGLAGQSVRSVLRANRIDLTPKARPAPTRLLEALKQGVTPFSQLARQFGLSDQYVRKVAKQFGYRAPVGRTGRPRVDKPLPTGVRAGFVRNQDYRDRLARYEAWWEAGHTRREMAIMAGISEWAMAAFIRAARSEGAVFKRRANHATRPPLDTLMEMVVNIRSLLDRGRTDEASVLLDQYRKRFDQYRRVRRIAADTPFDLGTGFIPIDQPGASALTPAH